MEENCNAQTFTYPSLKWEKRSAEEDFCGRRKFHILYSNFKQTELMSSAEVERISSSASLIMTGESKRRYDQTVIAAFMKTVEELTPHNS